MSILTHNEILKEIKKGNINIEPFIAQNVGPASVDLILDDKFRLFKRATKIVDVTDELDYQKISKPVKAKSIVILPGETILGITKEKISLAPNICGWLEGRSRFARMGLMVHISAPFMQPGISNQQVLEMSNMGHVPMRLHAGTRICQFIFQKTIGKAKYLGKFSKQKEP